MSAPQSVSFVLPLSPDMTEFRGFLCVGDAEYGLTVRQEVGDAPPRLQCSPELAAVLEGFESVVERKAAACGSVSDLVAELTDLCERILSGAGGGGGGGGEGHSKRAKRTVAAARPEHFARLVAEMEDRGLDVADVSERLDQVTLRATDAAGRVHLMTVVLGADYPASPPLCLADLPAAFAVAEWDPEKSGLIAVQRQFEAVVAQYQRLWNALDDLDARAWVLSETNSRASCSRRLVVAAHCYLQIDLVPLHPHLMPQIKFLGSDKLTQPLLDALNASAQRWDGNATLAANLERCLGVRLPPRPSASEKEVEMHANSCGICYEFHGEADAVPDVVCSNGRCGKCFHRVCLYEWLRSIPATKVSFSTVFGTCPFCDASMSFRVQ